MAGESEMTEEKKFQNLMNGLADSVETASDEDILVLKLVAK